MASPDVEDGGAPAPDAAELAALANGRVVEVACWVHEASRPGVTPERAAALRAAITKEVEAQGMRFTYDRICARLGWPVDAALAERLRVAHEAEIASLSAAVDAARASAGEVEAAAASLALAAARARAGDAPGAAAGFAALLEGKALSTGQKVDAALARARVGICADDAALAKDSLARAAALVEAGGDWDRRNRLKVYEGAARLTRRDFAGAAELLLDGLATFTAVELFSYERFCTYAVLAAVLALARDRPRLKKRVVDSPDVLAVTAADEPLSELLHGLYDGRYAAFFRALAALGPRLAADRFVGAHADWYARELRVAAYCQFLEAYKSVTLAGMAAAFGVGPAFLDAELARFVAAGRVPAKIDAVAGVIHTTRPDTKNAQYLAALKAGDALMGKVQRLGRVVAA